MSGKQCDITPAMRGILIDWLVEVVEEYRLHSETLFVCVRIPSAFVCACSCPHAPLSLSLGV